MLVDIIPDIPFVAAGNAALVNDKAKLQALVGWALLTVTAKLCKRSEAENGAKGGLTRARAGSL